MHVTHHGGRYERQERLLLVVQIHTFRGKKHEGNTTSIRALKSVVFSMDLWIHKLISEKCACELAEK